LRKREEDGALDFGSERPQPSKLFAHLRVFAGDLEDRVRDLGQGAADREQLLVLGKGARHELPVGRFV
jgi:hypothetical protein